MQEHKRPVVRLCLALNDHPLSGAYWGQYCNTYLVALCFEKGSGLGAMFRPQRDAIYTDYAKTARFAETLKKRWVWIWTQSRLGVPAPFVKYLECGHTAGHMDRDKCSKIVGVFQSLCSITKREA